MCAKRGLKIDATYFNAPPYTSERALQKVIDLASIVARYTGPIYLHNINFTEIQLYIYEKCPHDELTIIMRRYMMRIAERIALEHDCLALVTGESIGQVASQTMASLLVTNEVCETLPVFRPLIGFDKEQIVTVSKDIGAFETSILPFEDCCTIWVAKHPVTKPSAKVIRRHEEYLKEQFEYVVAHKDRNFGNARFARNVFEKSIQQQANRLAGQTNLDKSRLTELTVEDLQGGFASRNNIGQ
jgi:thiamine biosynthesis protein ThiI